MTSSWTCVTNGTIIHCHTTDYCSLRTSSFIKLCHYMHAMAALVSWHGQIFTDQISRTRKQNLVKCHIRIAILFMECYPGRKMTCAGAGAITVFRSNSKFEQNLKFFGLKYTQLITTNFGTCHDNVTVVTCAKFHCDRPNMLWTRALQISLNFQLARDIVSGTGVRSHWICMIRWDINPQSLR